MTSVFGLHITKCAGTSLANAVVNKVGIENSLLCSSFLETTPKKFIVDFSAIEQIHFGFGHFLHIGITECLRPEERSFLFTTLRNPKNRIISLFRQRIRECGISGSPLLTAENFLTANSNTITIEILRSLGQKKFPEKLDRKDFDRASNALFLFDAVVESTAEDLNFLASRLQEILGIENIEIRNHNTSEEIFKFFGKEEQYVKDFCTEQEKIIDEKFFQFNDLDIELYSVFQKNKDELRNNTNANTNRKKHFSQKFESRDILYQDVIEHVAIFHKAELSKFGSESIKKLAEYKFFYWSKVREGL